MKVERGTAGVRLLASSANGSASVTAAGEVVDLVFVKVVEVDLFSFEVAASLRNLNFRIAGKLGFQCGFAQAIASAVHCFSAGAANLEVKASRNRQFCWQDDGFGINFNQPRGSIARFRKMERQQSCQKADENKDCFRVGGFFIFHESLRFECLIEPRK